MTLSPDDVEVMMSDTHEAVKLANLRYVNENLLSISRKKVGRGFAYYRKDEKVTDTKTIERIKSLVIPPAWKNVKITHLHNGHLQVVGRDEKERKQYMYHPTWSKVRNQTKFFKMTAFGKMLPKIRKQVDEDLNLKGMPKRKVLALIIRLMEETHIRIGNEYYAKNNKTYGLSTFRTKHVKTMEDGLKFEFIGKKGKEHSISVGNIIGSNLFNILSVLGLVSIITPLSIESSIFSFEIPFMIGTGLLLIPISLRQRPISKGISFSMLIGYFIFIFILFTEPML